jgi:DNA-binding response OmpR family regulator
MGYIDAGILVVDDERFFREAIDDVLGNEGLDITLAESGSQALELAADASLGVVVLDIRMPELDGIQVLARLREIRPSLRVIMLSASTDQELVLEALRLGACDYLAKPLHDEELVLSVRRALESYSVAAHWDSLRGRLDRLVAEMETLARCTQGLEPEERLRAVHDGASRVAAQVLDAEKTSLMLLPEDGDRLEVVSAVGRTLAAEEMDGVERGESVAGVVIERSEPLVVSDVESDPLFAGCTHTDRYDSASFAVAPVISEGEPIGVVCATDRVGGADFDDDDLALLRLLAMQISELLSMREPAPAVMLTDTVPEELIEVDASAAQLADVLPKSEEGEELDRDAELARLICQGVVDEVEPASVIRAALRPLTHGLPAAPVALYLIDAQSGELALEGEDDGGIGSDRPRLERGRGLTGHVLQTGNMVATQDPEADPRFDPDVDTPLSGQVRPFLCLPMQLRGKVVGIFRAFLQDGQEGQGAGVASARTGEVLAATLSAAVRNVLLYRSLVETIEEVAEARRQSRG